MHSSRMRTSRTLTVFRRPPPGKLETPRKIGDHPSTQKLETTSPRKIGDPPGPDPPVNRMTDACENITLAKTSFRPVKMIIALDRGVRKECDSPRHQSNTFSHRPVLVELIEFCIFTGRNEVLAKVIILHLSVIHSVHRGGGCLLQIFGGGGVCSKFSGGVLQFSEYSHRSAGTHPTGMHSC